MALERATVVTGQLASFPCIGIVIADLHTDRNTLCAVLSVHGVVQQPGVELSAVESRALPRQLGTSTGLTTQRANSVYLLCVAVGTARVARVGFRCAALFSPRNDLSLESQEQKQRTLVRISTGSRNLELHQFDSVSLCDVSGLDTSKSVATSLLLDSLQTNEHGAPTNSCLDQCFSTAGPRPSTGLWH